VNVPEEQSRAALGPIGTDPDAFERFYREHFVAVQRFVARRVDNPYLRRI
jgi:RNA polymerase sigma-70 factor, ECF subfamily